MKKPTLILVLLLLLSRFALSQGDTTKTPPDTLKLLSDTTDLRDNLLQERLLETQTDDLEDSKLLDRLEYLKKFPLDLNTATKEEFEQLPFLNAITARNIVEYRNKTGKFQTKRELILINGISEYIYEGVKQYVVVKNSESDYVIDNTGNVRQEFRFEERITKKPTVINLRSRFQQDLQTREGYLSGNYPGSKAKVYNRLNFLLKKPDYILGANITIEKDAGETSLADFYSGYAQVSRWKFVNTAVAGDYTLNFGQGLGLWTSLSFSKGADATDPVKKNGDGIDGYRSTNEIQFFRGAATSVKLSDFNVYAFYSNNYFDATIDTTLDEVSSFYFDGYHRTVSERNRKNSARELFIGGRGEWKKRSMKFGITYWNSEFSKPVTPDSAKQLYYFSGDNASMLSIDYDFVFSNINFYGELARSQSGSVAGLGGAHLVFYKIADIVVLYRDYPEDFAPVHSFAFGESNGNTQNERGFYAGITLTPIKEVVINAYYDQFKFPYRTYYNPVPTTGNDFLSNIDWKVFKGFVVSLKYRNKTKEESRTIEDEFGRDTKVVDSRGQQNLRAGFSYDISNKLRLRSRYEYIFVDYKNYGGNNKGYLFFTDIRASVIKGMTLSTRFIMFDTHDYDSRVYEYEEDIRGVMSNIALYGKGTRWYLLLKYKPFDFLEVSAKYSETYIDGAKSIGTGNDKIRGNVNNRLNVGLEMLF